MGLYRLQPWCWHAVAQAKLGRQFHARKILQDVQHDVARYAFFSDLPVTMFSRLQDQIVGRNRIPETFIVHWLKPLGYLVYIFEFSHVSTVSHGVSRMQIPLRK